MHFFIETLQHWIQVAGGLGVFGASIVEEVISLIPSSLVQTAAGVFIMGGDPVNVVSVLKLIFQISIPAALGVTIGSLPYVWLARKFGTKIIDRWGKWIGVRMDDIRKLEAKFEKTAWDDIAFVGMRAFPVIPSVALAIYGGIIEMSWWRYMVLSFIGVFIRATALGILGWLFGSAAGTVTSGMSSFENIGLIVLVVLLAGWVLWMRKSKKANK